MISPYKVLSFVFAVIAVASITVRSVGHDNKLMTKLYRVGSLQSDTSYTERHNKLPDDTASIRLFYRGVHDTLYGYRSGKVFVFENDMLIKYPDSGIRGVATTFQLWTKKYGTVTIPYVIDTGYKKQNKVFAAMQQWMAKVPYLKFVSWIGQDDFIAFVPSGNTQSYVGKIGGRQTIELAGWADTGNIIHEIGHSLGLLHEQSRADRDSFVLVRCTDINYIHAFKTDPYVEDFGEYDYYSIMHYPPDNCMEVKKTGLPKGIPGQRKRISASDSATVKAIYKFP